MTLFNGAIVAGLGGASNVWSFLLFSCQWHLDCLVQPSPSPNLPMMADYHVDTVTGIPRTLGCDLSNLLNCSISKSGKTSCCFGDFSQAVRCVHQFPTPTPFNFSACCKSKPLWGQVSHDARLNHEALSRWHFATILWSIGSEGLSYLLLAYHPGEHDCLMISCTSVSICR
jgi:hypothetical protein